MKKSTMNNRASRLLPLIGLGAVAAAALSGCGGASTNVGGVSVATQDSGPVVYGLNASAVATGATTQGETSGISFTDASGTATGAVVAATNYTTVTGAGPLPVYKSSFPTGIPLGFPTDGIYFNSSNAVSAIPTTYAGSLVFGAYISTGVQNSRSIDLNTGSVVLTSPESPSFSQPLAFDPAFGGGVLSQAEYKTAAFPLPAFMQTTGLHSLHTTIADTGSPVQSSTTDFVVATVAPTDVALFLQSLTVSTAATATAAATTTTTPITPGDTVTIDNGAGIGVYPTSYTPTLADAQGTVVLFTTPGTHTLTETDPKGVIVQTEAFTLDATTAGTTILTPPTPDGTPAAAIRVVHHAIKRTIKH